MPENDAMYLSSEERQFRNYLREVARPCNPNGEKSKKTCSRIIAVGDWQIA
jgi:hypothetical protein